MEFEEGLARYSREIFLLSSEITDTPSYLFDKFLDPECALIGERMITSPSDFTKSITLAKYLLNLLVRTGRVTVLDFPFTDMVRLFDETVAETVGLDMAVYTPPDVTGLLDPSVGVLSKVSLSCLPLIALFTENTVEGDPPIPLLEHCLCTS